jgi:lipopolysaccharide transport system permease protein
MGEVALESVIDARGPALSSQLVEYWEYRGLLWHLVVKELKVRYRQTTLGILWSLAQPLLPALILGAVFSRTLTGAKGSSVPYALFLLSGLVPWSFLSNAVNSASGAFVSNGYFLTKVYFPRAVLPAASVVAASVEFVGGFIILCGWAISAGYPIRWSWLALPVLFICSALLAFLISIGIASLNVLYRDIRHALPFLLQVWMYATPILYSPQLVPEKWRWLLGLNPMTGIVLGFRSALFGTPFDLRLGITSTCAGVFAAITGIIVFHRLQHEMAESV